MRDAAEFAAAWGQPTQGIMMGIGLVHLAASSFLFVAFAALQFYKSL